MSYSATVAITGGHCSQLGNGLFGNGQLSQITSARRSQSDADVYLYYKPELPYFICVVARHLNGEGFVITAYRTNRIKIGDLVWTA